MTDSPTPNTLDILTAAIEDNRRDVDALLASIKGSAMRRGLDLTHGISEVVLLRWTVRGRC